MTCAEQAFLADHSACWIRGVAAVFLAIAMAAGAPVGAQLESSQPSPETMLRQLAALEPGSCGQDSTADLSAVDLAARTTEAKAVSRLLPELRDTDRWSERILVRETNCQRKAALSSTLRKKLATAALAAPSDGRSRHLSTLAYEIYLAESRLEAERVKLWQLRALVELGSAPAGKARAEAARSFLSEIPARRADRVRRLLALAEVLSPWIVEPQMRAQFLASLSGLRGERRTS